ncbi:GNAT family N-acetyltransferase [Undibacterium sp. Di27W]|uniref:GNAT family N-acetyltransferase n=1 Tax=Undibacterium sp. Di27W TaxID=3413036 RepID=UPI003BF1A641
MPYHLLSIPFEHLQALANASLPTTPPYTQASDALPPAFVATRALEQMAAGASAYWCSTFYIIATERQHIVGSCGFKHAPRDGVVEIGYGISPECRKQGAASAAVLALLQLAFDGGATQVLAEVNPANLASTRVVKKLGFVDTGSYIDETEEELVRWRVNKVDWCPLSLPLH